jgi:hypothetical protein
MMGLCADAFSPAPLIEQSEKQKTIDVDVQTFILAPESYFPELLSGSRLELESVRTSMTATHYHWQQIHNGLPIVGSYVTAHAVGSNQITLHYRIVDLDWAEAPPQPGSSHYFATRGALIPVRMEQGENNRVVYKRAMDDHVIYDALHKHALSDSLVTRVFRPNPILSARQPYGPPYVDNNDSNNQALTDELFWVHLPAERHGDTLTLSDTQFITKEVSIPNIPVPKAIGSDTILTDRSKDEFEQLNAFHHLIRERQYLHALGFDHLIRDTLFVDGQSGFSDNSFFFVSNQDGSRNLEFGIGGIDDGEDADVIIHEYGHYLLEQAVGWKPILTGDAAGINEGNCDYLAKTYALTFSDYLPNKLYTWDGNAFGWDGVQVRNDKTYDQASGNLLNDREIWVRPWMCIYDALGRSTTDSLFLEHLSYFTTGMSMPTGARNAMRVDTLLFNAKHAFTIRKCFCESKMLTPSECAVSVESTATQAIHLMTNSAAFLSGDGNLIFQSPEKQLIQEIVVFNISGERVWHHSASSGKVEISPESLPKGSYVAQIRLDNAFHFTKFIR